MRPQNSAAMQHSLLGWLAEQQQLTLATKLASATDSTEALKCLSTSLYMCWFALIKINEARREWVQHENMSVYCCGVSYVVEMDKSIWGQKQVKDQLHSFQ